MISHLFPIDFSLLYLSISCPFLLSPENKSKKYWYVLLFFIFLHSKTEQDIKAIEINAERVVVVEPTGEPAISFQPSLWQAISLRFLIIPSSVPLP